MCKECFLASAFEEDFTKKVLIISCGNLRLHPHGFGDVEVWFVEGGHGSQDLNVVWMWDECEGGIFLFHFITKFLRIFPHMS